MALSSPLINQETTSRSLALERDRSQRAPLSSAGQKNFFGLGLGLGLG